jgi:hypothetical protein
VSGPKVVELPVTDVQDIPLMLERLAAGIRGGVITLETCIVVGLCDECNIPHVYSSGQRRDTNSLVGFLSRTVTFMSMGLLGQSK